MIPYLHTPWGDIPTFTIFVIIGILSMLTVIHSLLSKSQNEDREESFILSKIVICGITGFFFAGVCDALFKLRDSGEFQFAGITFYGGLFGAGVCLYVLLKCSTQETQYSIGEWYNLLTLPLISFHFFGRLGCFFGGCCYGKDTDSFIGVLFPDNSEYGIFHHGIKCYPTQLFEAAVLMVIFVVILFTERKFERYLLMYSIARFVIEFFRGDNRGYVIRFFSPAQATSIILFFIIIIRMLITRWPMKKQLK